MNMENKYFGVLYISNDNAVMSNEKPKQKLARLKLMVYITAFKLKKIFILINNVYKY
jgi:hypothetical protein